VCVGAGEARRDLARSLRVSRQDGVVGYSPGGLVNESSIHELIEQLGLCVMQPPGVAGDHISDAGDTARGCSQQICPHTTGPDRGEYVTRREERVCDLRAWRKNGKDEGWHAASKSIKKKDAADLNFPHLQHLPFSTFVSSSPLLRRRRPIRKSLEDAV